MTDQNDLDLSAFNIDMTNEDGQAIESGEPTPAPTEQEGIKQPETTETPAEKPPESDDDSEDAKHVEDEEGKRYVPEARFKKTYGKLKAMERELESLRQQQPASKQEFVLPKGLKRDPAIIRLEAEQLKSTLPMFDQSSPEYSRELDELGEKIFRANPDMSLLEAGREALRIAKALSGKVSEARQEARVIKSINSDQGMTTAGVARREEAPNPDKMGLAEMEDYLRKTGQW